MNVPNPLSNMSVCATADENAADRTVLNNSTSNHPECTGRAAEALNAFRERESVLMVENQKKPDMVAYKELRSKWTPDREHGQIDGVPVGLKLFGRGEAAILGIHTQILRGIDAIQGESCYAICVAGKYADDDDGNLDGTLVYTGEGGQKKKNRGIEDQKNTVGNAALIRSSETQLPIRVLRGRRDPKAISPEYYYDGLYRCTGYTYEAGAEGKMVYKFTLVPIANESKARSIMVESTKPKTSSKERLLLKRKREDGGINDEQRKNATKPSADV